MGKRLKRYEKKLEQLESIVKSDELQLMECLKSIEPYIEDVEDPSDMNPFYNGYESLFSIIRDTLGQIKYQVDCKINPINGKFTINVVAANIQDVGNMLCCMLSELSCFSETGHKQIIHLSKIIMNTILSHFYNEIEKKIRLSPSYFRNRPLNTRICNTISQDLSDYYTYSFNEFIYNIHECDIIPTIKRYMDSESFFCDNTLPQLIQNCILPKDLGPNTVESFETFIMLHK